MGKTYITNYNLEIVRKRLFSTLTAHAYLPIFEVINLKSGDYLPTSQMENGDFKVYGGGGLTMYTHNANNVPFETLGIGRVGARCGCVFIIEPNSWVTDNALYADRIGDNYYMPFLVHYLNFIDLNGLANTSAQPVISQKRISKVKIPKIDINEQIQIANILDLVENGCVEFHPDHYGINSVLIGITKFYSLQTELDHQDELLKKLHQAILQDAVQGKLTESWRKQHGPATETAADLLARIRTEKAELVKAKKIKKEKPLPPISEEEVPFALPEGWIWCRLGEVVFNIFDGPFGSHLTTKDYVESGIQVIRLENIGFMQFKGEKTAFITPDKYEVLLRHTLQERDLLFSSFIGEDVRACIFPEIPYKAINKADCFCIRLEHDSILQEYLLFCFSSKYVRELLYHSVHGIARPRINLTQLKKIPIPLPPLAEQRAIVEAVEQALDKVGQLRQELAAQRAAAGDLLKALLHGAFRVEEEVPQSGTA